MTLGNGGETMGLRELSSRTGGASGRVKIYDEGVYHEPEVSYNSDFVPLFYYTTVIQFRYCSMIHYSSNERLFSSYVIVASLPSYFSCYSHTRNLMPGASMSLQR